MGPVIADPLRLLATAAPTGLPVARPVLHSAMRRVFGPPPFDADAHPGDPGLFGPGSASWRVVSEPAGIVGGIRALVVQLLHPLAMAGVADHSAFRDDAMDRLHRTSAYVSATTFGAIPEVFSVARTVRRAHGRVAGTSPDGRRYRAADPHLLAWVSIALTSSFLATDRIYAPTPAGDDVADAFVAEQSRAAALLDPRVNVAALERDADAVAALRAGTLRLPMLEDGTLPRTRAELDQRLALFKPELTVTDQSRQTIGFLLWPAVPAAMRLAYLPILAGAVASLDDDERELLGVPGGRVAIWPVRAHVRAVLAGYRITAGVSPSLRAAQRRANAT